MYIPLAKYPETSEKITSNTVLQLKRYVWLKSKSKYSGESETINWCNTQMFSFFSNSHLPCSGVLLRRAWRLSPPQFPFIHICFSFNLICPVSIALVRCLRSARWKRRRSPISNVCGLWCSRSCTDHKIVTRWFFSPIGNGRCSIRFGSVLVSSMCVRENGRQHNIVHMFAYNALGIKDAKSWRLHFHLSVRCAHG